MTDLHELEAIKRLKYKYLRCLDQKLWDEIGALFTADATCSYSGGKYAFAGRDAGGILRFDVGTHGKWNINSRRQRIGGFDQIGPATHRVA